MYASTHDTKAAASTGRRHRPKCPRSTSRGLRNILTTVLFDTVRRCGQWKTPVDHAAVLLHERVMLQCTASHFPCMTWRTSSNPFPGIMAEVTSTNRQCSVFFNTTTTTITTFFFFSCSAHNLENCEYSIKVCFLCVFLGSGVLKYPSFFHLELLSQTLHYGLRLVEEKRNKGRTPYSTGFCAVCTSRCGCRQHPRIRSLANSNS